MIRTSRMDHLLQQNITGLNVDLTPKPTQDSTTKQGPYLLPEDLMNMKKMTNSAPGLPHFNYVPVQNNVNKMAPEFENVPKVSDSQQMLVNAMKPVGKGATVFNPFNLLCG